eukprot:3221573-Rhodomonas_salina.5
MPARGAQGRTRGNRPLPVCFDVTRDTGGALRVRFASGGGDVGERTMRTPPSNLIRMRRSRTANGRDRNQEHGLTVAHAGCSKQTRSSR